ncbi:MAG: patatin-like phospholipase family protein [Chitinophagaceae bacterium]|nr:patatin-like phospholipase family protein [Rubrivivax sp.]
MTCRLHPLALAAAAFLTGEGLFFAPPAAAQSSAVSPAAAADSKRPKICLVLSGGGARGAAHVGVLKVLEEYRVPIDCIAGTSMGSLVGAAYATGMSIAQMEEINASISSELLFREAPPREALSMQRKQDDYGLFIGPEIGVEGGEIRLAKGLVTGVQLETVLRRLSRIKGFQKFDDLPIPYRAVATDLVTGREVVFSEGELADVMRASMSVPGAVAPAESAGRMLVDGMLTNNLPVSVARAMGADIVIAVNVGTPLLKREQLNGILGVTGQMLSILTEQNVQASLALLKPTDILISPDLGDYSTSDFDNLLQITPTGETAARKVADQLARLSIPADAYAALQQRRQVAVLPDTRTIDEIRFEPMRAVNPETLRLTMDTRAGNPIEQTVIDADMRRIFGLGNFEHVSYRFVEESGKRVMIVHAVERAGGLHVARFGLGLSSDFSGDAYFNLIGSYRRYWVNSLGAEWRTDLQIGRTSAFRTEFYQPLDIGRRFFVAPRATFERRSASLYQGEDRIASYDVSARNVSLDIGMQLSRYGEVRVGVLGGTLKPSLDTGPQSLSPGASEISQGAFTGRLVLDQLNSVHFPRSGWRLRANVFDSTDSLGADDRYTKWDVDGSVAYSLGSHTINLTGRFSGAMGSQPLPRYDMFQWGGFLQQSGYRTGQLYGQTVSFGRLMYYARILKGGIFEGAYGGFSLEAGKVKQPLVPGNPDGLLKSASLFVAADTPIGPAYLGYGRSAAGSDSFYFFLGRPY